jgi:seryl-tRNA synthetase
MTATDPRVEVDRVVAPYDTPEDLRSALVDRGVVHLTRVDGVYHRSWAWEQVLRGVEQYVAGLRVVQDAPQRWFPPVMPRDEFLLTDYVRSFPDLVGSIDVFTGGDKEHRELLEELEDGGDWTSHLTPAEVVLPSSVCHPLYGVLPKDVPAEGLHEECSGWSFRHEPSLDPARMQIFRIYEFVHVGTPEQALAHRDAWLDRGLDALRRLGLPVRAEAANDPFFGRVGKMLAANQLGSQLKYEMALDLTTVRPTAIGSSNYHEDHFGHSFGLHLADGTAAHSACIGFGLDRTTLALFATHGMDLADWPGEVRAALSC